MLAFIIPVKSKTVSSDWVSFTKLLKRTLTSVSNQTDGNFITVLVCHENPDIEESMYPNLHIICANFEPPRLLNNPQDYLLREDDKGRKLKLGIDFAQKIGADYIMTVDSDDCISNQIAAFVNKRLEQRIAGWYLNKGYLRNEGSKWCLLNTKNFNEVCGSVIIIKSELAHLMFDGPYFFDHLRTFFMPNLSLIPLPFPGAIYSMLNGNNHVLDSREMEKRLSFNPFIVESWQTLFRRLKKYRPVPVSLLKKEFGI